MTNAMQGKELQPQTKRAPKGSARSDRRKAWEWQSCGFAVALRCQDAYSAMAYRSWPALATALLKAGWSEAEAETIMRSKITRWARDAATKNYRHGEYPASVVLNYLKNNPSLRPDILRWTKESAAR